MLYENRLFFFKDTAATEIYALSRHDALPISLVVRGDEVVAVPGIVEADGVVAERVSSTLSGVAGKGAKPAARRTVQADRKSTRLNSSHANISYAVFSLKYT